MSQIEVAYLASPYSDPNPKVREARYQAAMEAVAASLADRARIVVYSPILHNHPMALKHPLPQDWGFWREIDLPMLARCDRVVVLKLDGWHRSTGVGAEIDMAEALDKTIDYVESWADFRERL